jgi:hypothetical protein
MVAKIFQKATTFYIPRPSKIYANKDFGLEIYHLATLLGSSQPRLTSRVIRWGEFSPYW